jgi:hypothetical protein
MFLSLLRAVQYILVFLLALIQLAEQPDVAGPDKRQEVLKNFSNLLPYIPMPEWLRALIGTPSIAGILIDLLVSLLNRMGWFEIGSVPPVDPTPAPGT